MVETDGRFVAYFYHDDLELIIEDFNLTMSIKKARYLSKFISEAANALDEYTNRIQSLKKLFD